MYNLSFGEGETKSSFFPMEQMFKKLAKNPSTAQDWYSMNYKLYFNEDFLYSKLYLIFKET